MPNTKKTIKLKTVKTVKRKPKKITAKKSKSVNDIGNDIEKILRAVKSKYDKLDPRIKKKIITGVATVGSLLVASAAIKKVRSTRNKK